MADLVQSMSEIFSNRVFTIPDYQRGYAWDKKQWNDLTQVWSCCQRTVTILLVL